MHSLLTERLRLRPVVLGDAAFIFELVNDPDWLHYIGDRKVYSLDDARQFIISGPQKTYAEQGLGMLLVETLDHGLPVGLCGLLQRDYLDFPDLGFAFLPAHRGRGYGVEASTAVLENARSDFSKIAGMTSLDNHRSISLLEKLGFEFSELIKIDKRDLGTRLFMLIPITYSD